MPSILLRSKFSPSRWLVAAAFVWMLAARPAGAITIFQVGNSFTNDSRPLNVATMVGSATGEEIQYGFHIRGGQTLQSLWSNPTAPDTVTSSYGNHTVALPQNAWDFLTVQSFPNGADATLAQEVARIADFVQAADIGSDGQTTIVVYGPWAGFSERDWRRWHEPFNGDPNTPAFYAASYHDALFDAVEEMFPDRVRLASAGKVIREVRDRILDKEIAIPFTSSLYRDAIHLSSLGQFIASTTVSTVISRENPVGVPVPRGSTGWSEATLSDDLARELQQIVWGVLVDDKRSGISPDGDFNIDTSIDIHDYDVWRRSFGAQTAVTYDATGDGAVDQSDVQRWIDALDPGLADLNGDGVTDVNDLAIWSAQYGDSGVNSGDGNGDGVVDAADYTYWRDRIDQSESVDFNQDGRVTALDGQLLLSQFGWSTHLPADGNGDGVINAADYTIWRDGLEKQSRSLTAVPEPSTLIFVAFTAPILLCGSFVRRVQAA